MLPHPARLAPLALVACIALACRAERRTPSDVEQAGTISAGAEEQGFDPTRWQPPAESDIPDESLRASIRRGRAWWAPVPRTSAGSTRR
jgi:hypothetical protein